MAKLKFSARLYENVEIIQAEFRAHQSTILQLSARYKVGQETMHKFLIHTLGVEYPGIVIELREMLKLNNRQSIVKYGMNSRGRFEKKCQVIRTKKDFSEEELKEIKMRIERLAENPVVPYHPYVVDPIRGEQW